MERDILLFGGSGRLGKAMQDISPEIIAPLHKECDIVDPQNVASLVNKIKPSVVINSAAVVGTRECEDNRRIAWQTNVEGCINIARVCKNEGVRVLFVSSAAIFNGRKGMYKETDEPTPIFYYAITKVAAEQAVRMAKDFAIVRLDFFDERALKYNEVFEDHFTSKIPAEEAARKVLQVATSEFVGIINIGQKRRSLYDILRSHHPGIEPIKIEDSPLPDFPRDISLNLELWEANFSN